MDDETISILGSRVGYGRDYPFGLRQADRRRHLYVIGQTGTGKTTLLRNLIIQDIEAGRGVAVIDPHGDLARELLDHVPPSRFREVVYFNPADLEHPIGLNVLSGVPIDRRPVAAEAVLSVFKHMWGLEDQSAPRLLWILYNCLRALLDYPSPPGQSILGVPRMLVDDAFRERVVRHVRDMEVRTFWLSEFAGYSDRFRSEAIAPILNKVGRLVAVPVLRNILGQVTSSIDLRFMLDHRRVLIANLSKGQLGEDTSNLLGGLLLTGFQLAAMSRADVAEARRADFHLIVDEAHSFTTDSFVSMLSEARKYALTITLGHQYVFQLRESVRKAVFGNVGSLISFRIGAADADELARELAPYSARSLVELLRFEVCAKMLSEGEVMQPFVGKTAPPMGRRYGKSDVLIGQSRERYTRPRAGVEDKINRWFGEAR